MISNMTPGTPNAPAIRAFNGLSAMLNPNNAPPMRLIAASTTKPIRLLINNFPSHLSGTTRSSASTYSTSNPAANASSNPINSIGISLVTGSYSSICRACPGYAAALLSQFQRTILFPRAAQKIDISLLRGFHTIYRIIYEFGSKRSQNMRPPLSNH